MKILWLTSSYPWEGDPYRGIFFQTQAQELSRLGVDVAIVVGVPWIPWWVGFLSTRYAHQRSAPCHQIDKKINIYRIPYFGHRFQKYLGRPHAGLSRKILEQLPFKPDLIHGHYAYPTGLAAVESAVQLNIPSVITLHGSDVNIFATGSRLGAKRFYQAIHGASGVLCVSQALREKTLKLTGISPQYLPIGISCERFVNSVAKVQAREALRLPIGKKIVLYVGNLFHFKGIVEALDAISHPDLADILGIFVGTGPLGESIAAKNNCFWINGVPNDRIPQYLAAADLLVLPSYSEGMPTVLIEAGACGTPVIATSVGGIPELLEDGRGIIIEPGSSEALKQAILAAFAEPQTMVDNAKRFREYVLKAFDARENGKQLLRIYTKLIQKDRAI